MANIPENPTENILQMNRQQKTGQVENEMSFTKHYAIVLRPLAGLPMVTACLDCEPNNRALKMKPEAISSWKSQTILTQISSAIFFADMLANPHWVDRTMTTPNTLIIRDQGTSMYPWMAELLWHMFIGRIWPFQDDCSQLYQRYKCMILYSNIVIINTTLALNRLLVQSLLIKSKTTAILPRLLSHWGHQLQTDWEHGKDAETWCCNRSNTRWVRKEWNR